MRDCTQCKKKKVTMQFRPELDALHVRKPHVRTVLIKFINNDFLKTNCCITKNVCCEIFFFFSPSSNSPSEVVKRLLEPLANEGRTLYLDNYYMCPSLAQDLLLSNTNSVGKVRANRKDMPRDLTRSFCHMTDGLSSQGANSLCQMER